MLIRDEIMIKLQDIFRENFNDDTLNVSNETSAIDIDDWDSFEQIKLILAIETEFQIKINISEISELKNVGSMIDLIWNEIK